MHVEFNPQTNVLKIIFSKGEEELYEKIVFLTANTGTPCEPDENEAAAWLVEIDDLLVVFLLTED